MNDLSKYMVSLLVRWSQAAVERRNIEKACGYPPIYGKDAEVLLDTTNFLDILVELEKGK